MTNQTNLFLYGVPGTGKTYRSKILGKRHGLPVIEGDTIKTELKKRFGKTNHPFLYLGTCQAYTYFGELNEENVIKGLLAVRAELRQAVLDRVAGRDGYILEGAFLDPQVLQEIGKPVLITIRDERLHKKRFYAHREKLLDFSGSKFRAARMVQEYLLAEAKRLGIEIVDAEEEL